MLFFSNKCGRLGNRLFAFGHWIANAHENGYTIINLSFDEYATFFQSTHKNLFCCFPAKLTVISASRLRSMLFITNKAILKSLRLMKLTNSYLHQIITANPPEYSFVKQHFYDISKPTFLKIVQKKTFVFAYGRFFRDYQAFFKHQDLIRQYFTPINPIAQAVSTMLLQAGRKGDILIGIHIRQGDYKSFVEGKYLYSLDLYRNFMQQIIYLLPDKEVCFFICSDDNWNESSFTDFEVTRASNHIVEDMYCLAGCDYILGPPSTFSLWASFYGKVPIYQVRDPHKNIRLSDFVLPDPEIAYNFSYN